MEEHKRVFDSPEMQDEVKKFKPYLEELQVATGKNTSLTLQDVLILHNNLDIENRMNLTMETWMKKALADERTRDIRKLVYELDAYNSKLIRLAPGMIVFKFFTKQRNL